MINMPEIKIGLVTVSRDCFPISLARSRMKKVMNECRKLKLNVTPCKIIIETEKDAVNAVKEMKTAGVNALTLYLGNFGPEGPATIFAREMDLPFMLCGAAEETRSDLTDGRGDAFCGMLNASFNCGLRRIRPYIPAEPVGLPDRVALMTAEFIDIARVITGIRSLKIFTFGPRPQDFFACNAPIDPLYSLGIEVMENSELDLYDLYQSVASRKKDINAIVTDMKRELGKGNCYPKKLRELAQFELALMTFYRANRGSCLFAVFANKCWPAFEKAFGFVPCYVNSRMAARGIPVACEVDLYGAVSEYMVQLASQIPATILDINNSVPDDIAIADLKGAGREDLFMGFHCGNTPCRYLNPGFALKYQLIMKRLMEPDSDPDITCGTLEGTLRPGPATVCRIQADNKGVLRGYIAEGHILDADPESFGSIGIFGIPDFARFYRHILLEKQFPHHTAVGFKHTGRILFEALNYLQMDKIYTPKAAYNLYPSENPFRN